MEFPDGLVVKDLALSLLWLGFNPWPGDFHAVGMAKKTHKTKTLGHLQRKNACCLPKGLACFAPEYLMDQLLARAACPKQHLEKQKLDS